MNSNDLNLTSTTAYVAESFIQQVSVIRSQLSLFSQLGEIYFSTALLLDTFYTDPGIWDT